MIRSSQSPLFVSTHLSSAAAGTRELGPLGRQPQHLHDLRHTLGSLLIQKGAPIVYVKEQMVHSSIQLTVDTYGHLIPGANVSYVDRLDQKALNEETFVQRDATQAHWTQLATLRFRRML